MHRLSLLGITKGMKVAVSIPDDVFAEADRVARQLGTTRSAFYGTALRAFLKNSSEERITQALDALAGETGNDGREFVRSAANRRLLASDW